MLHKDLKNPNQRQKAVSNGGSGVDKPLRTVGAGEGGEGCDGGEGGRGLGTHKALGAVWAVRAVWAEGVWARIGSL